MMSGKDENYCTIAVAPNENGFLSVFYVGANNKIWTIRQTKEGWSESEQIGRNLPNIDSSIAAIRNCDNRIEVFALGDKKIHFIHQLTPNGKFSDGSTDTSGGLFLTPPIVYQRNQSKCLAVCARGCDNNLYELVQSTKPADNQNPGWGACNRVTSWTFKDMPAVISNEDTRIEFFVRGLDDKLYHSYQDSVSSECWSNGPCMNIPVTGNFTVSSYPDGRLVIISQDENGRFWHTAQQEKNTRDKWTEPYLIKQIESFSGMTGYHSVITGNRPTTYPKSNILEFMIRGAKFNYIFTYTLSTYDLKYWEGSCQMLENEIQSDPVMILGDHGLLYAFVLDKEYKLWCAMKGPGKSRLVMGWFDDWSEFSCINKD